MVDSVSLAAPPMLGLWVGFRSRSSSPPRESQLAQPGAAEYNARECLQYMTCSAVRAAWIGAGPVACTRNISNIKIQDGETIMPFSFFYAQLRLLSLFRKCFQSIQVK